MVRLGVITALVLFSIPVVNGQTNYDSPKSSISAGFLYGIPTGRTYWSVNNAPGWSAAYSYQPRRWLLIETGLEQIIRPTGSSVCCRFNQNAEDQLYLVPFGVRYVLHPHDTRLAFSVGGGGAYANHAVGNSEQGVFSASAWGAQAVVAADYLLTRSGRFRVGLQGRFYYLDIGYYQKGRMFTIGPRFVFSWH